MWNSGIFVFPLSAIFQIYRRCLADMTAAFSYCGAEDPDSLREIYPSLESISFDRGILERCGGLYVVSASFGWDDVGSYSHLNALIPPDEKGNVRMGNCELRDTADSVILTDNRLTAVIGLKDVVIAENRGVLLVCHRSRVEEIRQLVDSLEGENASLR